MNPPDPFVWEQRDACEVRCTNCGETIKAGIIDLHNCQ